MSLDLSRDWVPAYGWIDFTQLRCDLCAAVSNWVEAPHEDLPGWDHLLGLDCCPDCNTTFYGSRLNP